MIKFVKNFGLGLVYFLVLPFLLVAVVGYLVAGIGWWLFYAAKGVVRFFRGESFFQELPEDAEVRRIKLKMAEASSNPNPAPAPAPAPAVTTTNTTNTTDTSQTYNVTNNFFGATPNMPGMGGIQTPNIGQTQPIQDRIDMEANTIDYTTSNPIPAQQAIPSNPQQPQIEHQETPLIENQDPLAQFDGIDLSIDEEDFK